MYTRDQLDALRIRLHEIGEGKAPVYARREWLEYDDPEPYFRGFRFALEIAASQLLALIESEGEGDA